MPKGPPGTMDDMAPGGRCDCGAPGAIVGIDFGAEKGEDITVEVEVAADAAAAAAIMGVGWEEGMR